MKRSGKILLEGTIEEFKKHCKGADNREYLLINTKEIKKDGTYTVYKLDSNTERMVPISARGKYGKLPPYSKLYLTFVAKSNGTFKFSGKLNTNTIQYSTDNGNTWSEPSPIAEVNVNNGDKVMWKGEMSPSGYNAYPGSAGIGGFSGGTAEFDIQGNIMSLLYGDNFIGRISLDGKAFAFYSLFYNTKSVNANNLSLIPTVLSQACYCYMFYSCPLLTTAPELPATTLANNCYSSMFGGCYSLISAPKLPATTLASGCYSNMFNGCSLLTTAPELPVVTLTDYCYSSMFNGCTSLTTAPTLPAITLTRECYSSMFKGCTSLTQAPQLLATTLAQSCYSNMFQGCTSLTQAPELPATTLVNYCYFYMFQNCTNLNYVKMLATDISANDCLNSWIGNVAATGTMVVNGIDLPVGDSGVPSGWTVQDIHDYSLDYLTFVATSDGTFLFSGSSSGGTVNTIQYSTDNGETWSEALSSATVNVNIGDKVLWKGEMTPVTVGPSYNPYKKIGGFDEGTANFDAKGNIMSLLYGDNFRGQTSLNGQTYALSYLFSNSKIVDASNLILPTTTLTKYCYVYMFFNCTSLTTAPSLPATTLTESCYSNMFNGCTSLTAAPQLPATTLAGYCYQYMFCQCASLITALELPATTLADSCYRFMFKGCTSLTTTPELPATILINSCYSNMFNGCTNLNTITMLATDISANSCLNLWVSDVGATGTFVKNASMITLPTGENGIPSGWTVEDYVEE